MLIIFDNRKEKGTMDDKVVERHYDEFLEKYREQWIKQDKLVVENFPFLTLTSALPFPSEISRSPLSAFAAWQGQRGKASCQ